MSQDYTLLRTRKFSDLEVLYNMHICAGEVEEAYEVLGTLMKYRLIEKNDPRLDKSFKLFKNAGISPNHRFLYDYRRDYNYIAQSIYFECPRQFKFKLIGEKHWGKRIEGNYEGDVIVPEKVMEFSAKQVNTTITVQRALEEISKIYKETFNKNVNLKNVLAELLDGESKLYQISLCSEYNAVYRELGYILFYVGTESIVAKIILNHKRVKGNYIDLLEAYKIISVESGRAFMEAGNTAPFKPLSFYNLKALKEQVKKEKEEQRAKEEKLNRDKEEAVVN